MSKREKMDFLQRSANSGPHFEGRVPETVSTICVIVVQTFREKCQVKRQACKTIALLKRSICSCDSFDVVFGAFGTMFGIFGVFISKGTAGLCH